MPLTEPFQCTVYKPDHHTCQKFQYQVGFGHSIFVNNFVFLKLKSSGLSAITICINIQSQLNLLNSGINSVTAMSPTQAEVSIPAVLRHTTSTSLMSQTSKDSQRDVCPSQFFPRKHWSCYLDKSQDKLICCSLTICKAVSNKVLQLCNATFVLF